MIHCLKTKTSKVSLKYVQNSGGTFPRRPLLRKLKKKTQLDKTSGIWRHAYLHR